LFFIAMEPSADIREKIIALMVVILGLIMNKILLSILILLNNVIQKFSGMKIPKNGLC